MILALCSVLRASSRSFLLLSSQSNPSNQTASSLSSWTTSSRDILHAFLTASHPSAAHSITNLRTIFFIGGRSSVRSSFMYA
ncbi:hypothetical protein IW261DRAFT_1508578 [Armillaria novae-zelandiae]|uniref:Uncharacterized protein n=1 Tax=Armillaria novae-zelandiae TaxID=153914 RepID=A0AA39U1E4_9AGAR|nr:hypothetical protein IW261DRAFT_1508578 [Armillaria novae-zelandiae]